MWRLEVSAAVRHICMSLRFKRLKDRSHSATELLIKKWTEFNSARYRRFNELLATLILSVCTSSFSYIHI